MPTAKQTAANRTNAQKSSGPRTTAGKATSRFNALKHGIYAVHQVMFDEKAEDLAELSAEYHEHYSPADPQQRFLVDTLVANEWRLRRMRRVEAGLWYRAYNSFVVKNIEVTLKCTSGDAFATDSSMFERLQRIVNSCERAYHRALKELQRLQAAAHGLNTPEPEASPTPQPQQSTPDSAKMASFSNNPKTASQPQAAPQSAAPDAPANPAEAEPSATNPEQEPPEAA
jgi:hypothetical protein